MKKPLISLIALTASVVSANAFAASNMENPLYMPQNREVYLKTAVAGMYKTVEGTQSTDKKGTSGQTEFPVWRFFGDIGYGITDRLDVHGHFGYTRDNEINRKGMHRGRIGLMYRVLTDNDPFVLDLYGDAYLSGITPMKGTYTNKGFDFANYSNGRWGAIVGTRFGKTWNDFTLAAHVEYLQTFGNHNNKIALDPALRPLYGQFANPAHPLHAYEALLNDTTMSQLGFPAEISVDLKSTHETVAGFDAMYQLNKKWSLGGGFEYIEHYDNGVKGIYTKLATPNINPALPASVQQQLQDGVVKGLLDVTKDMDDGWDEYVIKTNVAYQYSDDIQFSAFFEYTLDEAHAQSQNATDEKMELGIRMGARF